MQLENSFTVPVPVDDAWRVLLDIERIAPCMPGAALDSVEGDSFTGRVKVKLGPINLTYQGKASFVEKDEAAHRAVIDAKGKDQRGNGTAAAVITARLAPEGAATRVDVPIEAVIARHGPRVPSSAEAQTQFRMAFLLVCDGDCDPDALAFVEEQRQAWPDAWAAANRGLATADTSLDP